ncbi:MAG: hypothetical protein JXA68_06280 [Ignavibacteriales bacterium]|nr:hypothetical protein [Ignavibacteriales bacterium]
MIKYFVLITFLILIISCNNSFKNGSLKSETNRSFNFINQNAIVDFYSQNDTLFSKTTNGYKYYDATNDCWCVIEKEKTSISDLNFKKKLDNINYHFPQWYPQSNYTSLSDQYKNWLLVGHGNEAGFWIRTEIVDTISKQIFNIPIQTSSALYVDEDFFWIGTMYGISKINKKTGVITEYLTNPAITKIKGVHALANSFYYIDFHYGLYKYDKLNRTIESVQEFNSKYYIEGYKFINSVLIDKCLYILSCKMDIYGQSNATNASLLVYNTENSEIKEYKTTLNYFDSFLINHQDIYIYGEFCDMSEDGCSNYGGLALVQQKNDTILSLIDAPIAKVYIEDGCLKAISIEKIGDGDVIKVKHYSINKDFSLSNLNSGKYCNPYFYRDNKDGDTIVFENESYLINKEKGIFYYNIINERYHLDFVDTIMIKQPIIFTESRYEKGII